MAFWHHIPLGVDFKGGTLVYVKFADPPDNAQLRSATDKAGIHDARIQSFGLAANHEVIISLPQSETSESALDAGRAKIVATLEANYAASGRDRFQHFQARPRQRQPRADRIPAHHR